MHKQDKTLTPEQFAAAFPFHIIFDSDGHIIQMGPSLERLRPHVQAGDRYGEHFEIERPKVDRLSADTVERYKKGVFILRTQDRALRLRGQMQVEPSSGDIYFLGSPWVTDLSQLRALGLTMSDFAVHDPITDMLALLRVKDGALADAKRLAERLQSKSAHLREAKAAADRANQAKTQFVAMVSHEIRTSLNALLGLSELLMQTPSSDEQREFSETIHLAGHALLRVLNDVLDLSKIEADKLELSIEDMDVQETVNAVIRLFRENANQKGVVLDSSVAADVPRSLIGDPARLQQILSNLVGNALKFTRAGSIRITVTASRVGDEYALRFDIADTGIGIAPEAQIKLFEPFTQSEKHPQQYGGTGLGLAICKRLVGLMGGDIGVTSELGQGSCFWFTIRARENHGEFDRHQRPVAVESHSQLPTFSGHVLIVDDNRINRLVARRMVQKLGLTADEAENGQQALQACEHNAYDVVLMDMHMPDMNGSEVAAELRGRFARSGARAPAIIISSADVLINHESLMHEFGMDAFLNKPISIHALANLLGQWLES